jgi:hypothetical protein
MAGWKLLERAGEAPTMLALASEKGRFLDPAFRFEDTAKVYAVIN